MHVREQRRLHGRRGRGVRRRHPHREIHFGGGGDVAHPLVARLVAERARHHVIPRREIRGHGERSANDELFLENRERLLRPLLFQQDRLRPGDAVKRDPRRRIERQDGRDQKVFERRLGVHVQALPGGRQRGVERCAVGRSGARDVRLAHRLDIDGDPRHLRRRRSRSAQRERRHRCREQQLRQAPRRSSVKKVPHRH